MITRVKNYLNRNKYRKLNHKIFCIGSGKTGTTSVKDAFLQLGFLVGNQRNAELLNEDYLNCSYGRIFEYCKSADVFQDVPFCFPNLYKELDSHFSNSKFILTIRDNSEQWYNSFCNFQSKVFGSGDLLDWNELKNVDYVKKGWSYDNRKGVFKLTENDHPYDKEKLIAVYEKHNKDVVEYFKDRPSDLLVINISEQDAYKKFCKFIGVKSKQSSFPWSNKTSEIKIK